MATTATIETPEAIASQWVAIAYNPSTVQQVSEVDQLLNPDKLRTRPPAPLTLFLPPYKEKGGAVEAAPVIEHIFLRIGSNLDVDSRLWAEAARMKTTKDQIQLGAIRVFIPENPETGDPGYRHFSSESAIALVRLTMHEDWIDMWMVNENRAEVIKVGNEQKAVLIEAKKKRIT